MVLVPVNMSSASESLPVFMKNCFLLPSSAVVVIFIVEADDMPAPPWLETEVLFGSSASSFTTALSSFMVDANEVNCRRRDSIEVFSCSAVCSDKKCTCTMRAAGWGNHVTTPIPYR